MMERLPRSKVAWLLALLLLSGAANIIGVAYAFVAVVTTPARSTSHLHPAVAFRMQPHVGVATTLVSMAAEKGEETTDEVTEITAAADESDDEDGEDDDEVTEEEEPKEDPELTALKEEIAKLEADLKKARRKVADTSDRVEDFSKPGYARKVAEMENMRRARSMLQSSNKYSATANVLTEFLPVLDTLVKLREKYGDDEFGKQYNALYGALRDGFAALGATEFAVVTGDVVDKTRTVVVDSEYSTEFPVNAVIRPVTVGMELQGNVLRMAECVASLGAEPAAVAEEKESVAAESADDESSEDEQQEGESNEN